MQWTKGDFLTLALWLYDAGFDIKTEMEHSRYQGDSDFWSAVAKNDQVEFRFFWESTGEDYHRRLFGDNSRCFDRLSTCPLAVFVSGEEILDLFEKLPAWIEFLGSDEGYKYSNEFQFLDSEQKLPRQLPEE